MSWDSLSSRDLLLLVFFLPNVVLISPGPIPFFSISWSVGVEEQFYLMWPVLLKFFKNTFLLLIAVIAIYLFIKIPLFSILKYKLHASPAALAFFKSFWANFNIDSMAIGGIFSYLFFIKHKALDFFYLKPVQIISLILLIAGLVTGFRIPFINNELYSVFFAIFIVNIATNPKTIIHLENKAGNFLGKISYGLYMYHSLCIVLCIKLLKVFHLVGNSVFSDNILIYIGSILLSIFISSLSYNYLEKSFLKIKEKIALVKSSGESGVIPK
jgi:peptidoglycan/LPS O-acetylase OafA/YrhL